MDSVVGVSLSPLAKPVRFVSDVVMGRRLYPFLWALPAERQNPRTRTNLTPDDPALTLIPNENYDVSGAALSFGILPASVPGASDEGRLRAEVTTLTHSTVGYSTALDEASANVSMLSGRIWSQGGIVKSTQDQYLNGPFTSTKNPRAGNRSSTANFGQELPF